MKSQIRKLFIGVIVYCSVIIPHSQVFAQTVRTYYVATTGSDTNPGTQSQPFLTIQKAVDQVSQPGDTVLVLPGEYHSMSQSDLNADNAINVKNKNGTPDRNIVIRAYDPNHKPVIVNRSTGFRIYNSTYVTFEGFEIKDFINTGFAIYLSSNITVQNNYIHLQFQGLCQPGEGLPFCKTDGSGAGQPKGRIDNLGQYIQEFDNLQNTGVYFCKSQDNLITGNRIENTDEGIYVGTSGNVVATSCTYPITPRTWTSGNVIENNYLQTTLNEGIELKPDAIRTTIKNNLLKNTAGLEIGGIEIRSAYNDVSGNVIYGDNQYSKTGIRMIDETLCATAPNDDQGKPMSIYPKNGGYICAFGNNIHYNYIYYTQGDNYIPAIQNHNSSAGNIIDHNTIVGGNDFGIISDAVSSSITNNLILGDRGKKTAFLNQESSAHPLTDNFNAYYPNKKSANGGCIIQIAGITMGCTTAVNTQYDVNSVFMTSSPVGTFQPATSPLKIDAVCAPTALSTLDLPGLKTAIINCSQPLANAYGTQIMNKASDGSNIGAWQKSQVDTLPTPTVTSSPAPAQKPGDTNNDGNVDSADYLIWLNYFGTSATGPTYGDFDNNSVVDGKDYAIWQNNYGK